MVRPANFGDKEPGLGLGVFEAGSVTLGVTNVLGRVFVERTVSPFEAADLAIEGQARGADLRRRLPRRGHEREAGTRPLSRREGAWLYWAPTRTCPRRTTPSCPAEPRT